MSENTDVMRKGYYAFACGDMDTVRSIWAEDIDWQGPDERLPPGGHFNGPDEVIGMLAKLPEHYDELGISPDEYLGTGTPSSRLGTSPLTSSRVESSSRRRSHTCGG